MAKTLIVYYSMSGNTEWAAERIAGCIGADLLRLKPRKAYPSKGFRKFLWGGKSAVMAEAPALEPYSFDSAAYERIIFGFPVWAGTFAPPLRSFVKEAFAGASPEDLRFAAFACQSGSGAEKAFAKLSALLARPLEATLVLIDPKDRPAAENELKISGFCAAMGEPDIIVC